MHRRASRGGLSTRPSVVAKTYHRRFSICSTRPYFPAFRPASLRLLRPLEVARPRRRTDRATVDQSLSSEYARRCRSLSLSRGCLGASEMVKTLKARGEVLAINGRPLPLFSLALLQALT